MSDAESERRPAESLDPPGCARRLLVAYRRDEDPEPYLSRLARYDESDLGVLRRDRDAALAFWTNLYNAGTQRLLAERPELYESPLRTVRFFRATCARVARAEVSLDDIEHGILRGSRSKYGLGYLPRLASGSVARRYRLRDPDPRVHFALNCGAASCPAILAYDRDRVDEQLDRATRTYLDGTVTYDPETDVAEVPRLFLWYRGDFGGRAGVVSLLAEHGAVPAGTDPDLRYRSWDWSLAPGKFHESADG